MDIETSAEFYKNINSLSKRVLGKGGARGCPLPPKDYRGEKTPAQDSGTYALLYEEELHLADNVAFLAHNKEGVEFVSAAAVEESRDPPALTVRLASNHTPTPAVIEGLLRIFSIVEEHANQGRDRAAYKARLFDEVVRFSSERIFARLRSPQWRRPAYHGRDPKPVQPLHAKVKQTLASLRHLPSAELSLQEALASLADSMERVGRASPDSEIDALKEMIQNAYTVSNLPPTKSLECNLRNLGLPPAVTESRKVLEIDKLSKYLEICDDLIRISRQSSSRDLCQNIKLEICPAYKERLPFGASERCFVHGEVQLVLHYERYPTTPITRAIGSSKSACYLCDLFIKKHGRFGISHSHMHLYTKWTVPESPWMSTGQIQLFRGVIHAMISEITALLKRRVYCSSLAMESRAHFRRLVQDSSLPSSVASSEATITQAPASPLMSPRNSPLPVLQEEDVPKSTEVRSDLLFCFDDLPIAVDIVASTLSCTVLVGKVDYIFDLEEVGSGRLLIEEATSPQNDPSELRVDVRNSSQSSLLSIGGSGVQMLNMLVHDSEDYPLRLTFIWDSS